VRDLDVADLASPAGAAEPVAAVHVGGSEARLAQLIASVTPAALVSGAS
jgi:hypothetical protein